MKPPKPFWVLIIGFPVVIIVWAAAFLSTHENTSVAALEPLFSGLGFVAIVAALIQSRDESARAKHNTDEMLYIQALANEIMAYGVLAEHVPEDVMNQEFRKRLVKLAGDMKFARERAEDPLAVKMLL
jgi:predicted nicotinamide N-methyase